MDKRDNLGRVQVCWHGSRKGCRVFSRRELGEMVRRYRAGEGCDDIIVHMDLCDRFEGRNMRALVLARMHILYWIGRTLADDCRVDVACPFKALLPEWKDKT